MEAEVTLEAESDLASEVESESVATEGPPREL